MNGKRARITHLKVKTMYNSSQLEYIGLDVVGLPIRQSVKIQLVNSNREPASVYTINRYFTDEHGALTAGMNVSFAIMYRADGVGLRIVTDDDITLFVRPSLSTGIQYFFWLLFNPNWRLFRGFGHTTPTA